MKLLWIGAAAVFVAPAGAVAAPRARLVRVVQAPAPASAAAKLAIDILDPGEIVDPGSFSWADGVVPRRSSGEGRNIGPDIYWAPGPSGDKVKDHVLLVESLDKSGALTTHWIVLGVERRTTIPEGGVWETPPPSIRFGTNSAGKLGYTGPKPAKGEAQACVIEVFALDKLMTAPAGATRDQVVAEMKGHVVSAASLRATYTGGSAI